MDLMQTPQRLDAFTAMAWAWAVDFLPRLTMAIIILVVGSMIAGWVSRLLGRIASRSSHIDSTIGPVVSSIARYAIMILVLVAALGQIGVQTASLLAVLGAAGLAIGLALQGTLTNISAGIMLLWLRPFRVGDYIEVGGGTAGTVREIGLFACLIESFDGILIFAPNGTIWNSSIRNHTRNNGRLVSLSLSVPKGEHIEAVRRALIDMSNDNPSILRKPAPDVFVDGIAGDALQLSCRFWVSPESVGEVQRRMIEDVRERLQRIGGDTAAAEKIARVIPPDSDPSRLIAAGVGRA